MSIHRGIKHGIACFLFFISLLLPHTVFAGHVFSSAQKSHNIDESIAVVYNRYSKHFDEHGLVLKVPDYDISYFKKASSARELMSLAMYYKYRAINGDAQARKIIRNAILDADHDMESRPLYTQSFEDAAAQFLIIRALEQIPSLLGTTAENLVSKHIQKRMWHGIEAKDTSNRALLSAVYWQYMADSLFNRGSIDNKTKAEMNRLIHKKILTVLKNDITTSGWYEEGIPARFNPHYHVISAVALEVYGQRQRDKSVLIVARKMAENLRLVSFRNGMIEASLGTRPVGLGAQFYLGATYLLNAIDMSNDANTYATFSSGDAFFTDSSYPNRLEYHSTREGSFPDFHDDYAYSNMAELVLTNQSFARSVITSSTAMSTSVWYFKDNRYTVINTGDRVWFNTVFVEQKNEGKFTHMKEIRLRPRETIFDTYITRNSITRSLVDGDHDGIDNAEEILRGTNPITPDTDSDGIADGKEILTGSDPLKKFSLKVSSRVEKRYGKTRFTSPFVEDGEATKLHVALEEIFGVKNFPLSGRDWINAANAYMYGRYTVDEIVDSITHPENETVSANIPANDWRKNSKYWGYLERLRL